MSADGAHPVAGLCGISMLPRSLPVKPLPGGLVYIQLQADTDRLKLQGCLQLFTSRRGTQLVTLLQWLLRCVAYSRVRFPALNHKT